MSVIEINLPEKYFEKDKSNQLEARLAKFNLKKGDTVRFCEVDDEGEKTGRYYDRKVKNLHTIHEAPRHWSREDLDRFGVHIFELDDLEIPIPAGNSIYYTCPSKTFLGINIE